MTCSQSYKYYLLCAQGALIILKCINIVKRSSRVYSVRNFFSYLIWDITMHIVVASFGVRLDCGWMQNWEQFIMLSFPNLARNRTKYVMNLSYRNVVTCPLPFDHLPYELFALFWANFEYYFIRIWSSRLSSRLFKAMWGGLSC